MGACKKGLSTIKKNLKTVNNIRSKKIQFLFWLIGCIIDFSFVISISNFLLLFLSTFN